MKISDENYQRLKFIEKNKAFLGKEFLTWLWYKSETRNHKFTLDGLGSFILYLDDRLKLGGSSGYVREHSLKGGTPAYSLESKSALTSGKLLLEAKMILQCEEKQWSFLFVGESFELRNLKLPNSHESDLHAHITSRIRNTQFIYSVLEALLKEFFQMRQEKTFSDEIRNFTSWTRTESISGLA